MKHLCRQSLTTWMRPVNSCTFSDQVEADADAVDVVGDDPILSWPSYGSWSHDKKWWSGSRHCWHWSYGKGAGKREWWWSKGLQDDTASDRWYESVAEGEGSLAVMAGATGRKSICPLYPKVAGAVRRPWTPEDIRVYFRAFLREFVPANSSEEWCQWEDMFVGHGGTSSGSNHWTSRPVSLDMLKQFLMNQVTKAAVAGMGRAARGKTERVGDKSFLVDPASRAQFRDLVCNQDAAGDFLARYAPVGKADIETNS
jgi:hypothetical protein